MPKKDAQGRRTFRPIPFLPKRKHKTQRVDFQNPTPHAAQNARYSFI